MLPTQIDDEPAMVEAGRQLGAAALPGDVLALVGDLGAGKTHLAKGIAAGADYEGEVTSPTYALVQEYRSGRLPVFHFDLYRLDHPDELLAIGWDDYLEEGGLCIVEWADKFPALIPETARWLHLTINKNGTRALVSHLKSQI